MHIDIDQLKFKHCIICGEKTIEGNQILKKFEIYGGYGIICHDCLNIPIRCIKNNITLSELIHRVRLLVKK